MFLILFDLKGRSSIAAFARSRHGPQNGAPRFNIIESAQLRACSLFQRGIGGEISWG